jgi:hypothetical protein
MAITIWVGRDYSLPQGCSSNLEPHLPTQCNDPEHTILAMSDSEYAQYLKNAAHDKLSEEIGQILAIEQFPELMAEWDCTVGDGLDSEDL